VARGAPVIVMYMAIKHLGQIAGRADPRWARPDELVAIVAHATTERQEVLETTLGGAAADLSVSGMEPPAIVVVGEVVRLRAALDWLGATEGRVLTSNPLGTRLKAGTGELA
jgi:uroporphyrin-III C-methyltransferase